MAKAEFYLRPLPSVEILDKFVATLAEAFPQQQPRIEIDTSLVSNHFIFEGVKSSEITAGDVFKAARTKKLSQNRS